MIHINKGKPLPEFVDFLAKEHPTKWEDIHQSKRYHKLGAKCRDHILLEEQNMIGGYTECPLWNAHDLHIDHFRKKGMNWPHDVTWDWDNFIVETRNQNYGACYKDSHTSDIADYDLMLDPVVDYPEAMMTYLPNGQVTAKQGLSEVDAQRAAFTIKRFNLEHESLRQMRYEVIRMINQYHQLSDNEIRSALADQGFPSVVEWALQVRAVNR